METVYDYKKFAVLYVDDEEMSLKYFSRGFDSQFRILTASSAEEGLRILEKNMDGIGLLMTDQRMPGQQGVWLLQKARQACPKIIRILATAYADMDAAIQAVNSGAIYKYITKPWEPPQLESTLKRGLEFFLVQRERDELLRERMSVLHNMTVADRLVSLGLLAAGLSHHIRNSLVAVKTFLDLAPSKLQEEQVDAATLKNPEFWRDYYHNVQEQIEKINDLLKDLWDASDPSAPSSHHPVRLGEILSSVLAQLNGEFEAKRLKVVNMIPESLPAVAVDATRFKRMFELLLRDEITSLPEESVIRFEASLAPGSTPASDEIEIRISDNGPGISKEALRMIFDPFSPRADNPKELGIHLMACYFIVHHHGGRMQAESLPAGGTLFTMRIPLQSTEVPIKEESTDFLHKVALNEAQWQKLLASAE